MAQMAAGWRLMRRPWLVWMNERVYEACARLTDDQRKRNVGAVFQFIHGILNHI